MNSEIKDLLMSDNVNERIKGIQLSARGKEFDFMGILFSIVSNDSQSKVRYFARKALAYLNQLKKFDLVSDKNAKFKKNEQNLEHESDNRGAEQGISILSLEERRKNLREVRNTLLRGSKQEKFNTLRLIFIKKESRYIPAVAYALSKENDEILISALLIMIGFYGDTSHEALIKNFFRHRDHRVRANAIEAAASIAIPGIFDEFTCFENETDNRILANYALAIKGADKQRSLAILERMVVSGRPDLCDSAIYALARSNFKEAPLLLSRIIEFNNADFESHNDKNLVRELKEKARYAIKYMHTRGFNVDPEILLMVNAVENQEKEPDFKKMLLSADFFIRSSAVEQLKKSGRINSIKTIEKLMTRERDYYILSSLMTIMGNSNCPRTAAEILHKFVTSGDHRTRANAIQTLSVLSKKAEKSSKANESDKVVGTTEFENPFDCRFLKGLLFSWNHRIAMEAAIAIAEYDSEAVKKIIGLNLYTEKGHIRDSAIRAAQITGFNEFKNKIESLKKSHHEL